MNNPIKTLTKREWSIWLGSIIIVLISNLAIIPLSLLGRDDDISRNDASNGCMVYDNMD